MPPPTPSAPRPKTLKIGYLWLIKRKLTGWTMNNRFCILTNANELEWYKRQEDQVDHKPGGAFKKLESCELEETEDLNGQPWCFSIKASGKMHYFAATGDQDRMNWMVEILKLRPHNELINMLDHQKLSKHAAFALANLCGAKDHVVNIVKIGGTQALVGFLDKLNPLLKDEIKLIDSIHYLLSKLCEREECKQEIGQHFQMLIDLFNKSSNEKYQEYIATAVYLCCTMDENRVRFNSMGGLKWAVETLERDVGDKAKLLLADSISQVSNNDQLRNIIRDTYLEGIVNSLGKAKESVKDGIIRLLVTLAGNAGIVEKLKKITVLPLVVPLLISTSIPLQESSSNFVSFLLKNDDNDSKHKAELRGTGGIQNLISSLASQSDRVKERSLSAIYTFVSSNENNAVEFSKQGEGIIPIINLIAAEFIPPPLEEKKQSQSSLSTPALVAEEDQVDRRDITKWATYILKTLSLGVESRVETMASAKTITAYLDGLQRLKDDFIDEKLVSLANYTTINRFKLEFCKSNLVAYLVDRLSGSDTRGLADSLVTLSNCSTMTFGKLTIGRLSGLGPVILILKNSSDDNLRHHAATIIANCSIEPENAGIVKELGGVAALVGALSSTNNDLLHQSARALANIAFFDETDVVVESNGAKPLVNLLSSSNALVREYATKALRNCSVTDKGKTEIYQSGCMLPLINSLAFPDLRVQEHSALVIRNCISKEGTPNEIAKLGAIKPLLNLIEQSDIKVLENALWVLSYCHSSIPDKLVILKSAGIPLLMNCIEGKNERVKEVASLLVTQCLRRPKNETKLVPIALQKMYSLLAQPNPKVVENILSIIYYTSKNPEMKKHVQEDARKLIPFLRSSNPKVRHYAGGALINSALTDGDVDLKSIGGLATLLNLPDIQIRHNNAWKIKVATANDPEARKIEVHTTKQPAITFIFKDKTQMKYRLAKCLSSCYYGQEYRPEEEDYRTVPKDEESKGSIIESRSESEVIEEPVSIPPSPSPPPTTAPSPAPATRDNVSMDPNQSGNVSKVKEMFNNMGKPGTASAPPSPSSGTSPTLPRAPSKKGFGSTISPSPAATNAPGRDSGKRVVNQFLGIKRKGQTPSLPRRKEKVKFSHEQMEAMAHYRSLSNLSIAQYYDSVLSYFRESFLKVGEDKEVLRTSGSRLETAGAVVTVEDNYIVRYSSGDMGAPGLARAEKPFATDSSWAYFEVYIISAGTRGTIAVGLATSSYPLDQQPGWQSGSYGYHGDDGNRFFDSQNDSFGPRFTTGDIIGCGFNNITRDIFFTKNGFLIGTAFESAPMGLHPVVGLAGPGERVYLNFGQYPFVFDFNFKTSVGNFTPAPRAEPGQEHPAEPVPKVLSGEIGEAFETFAADWYFLHPETYHGDGSLSLLETSAGDGRARNDSAGGSTSD